MGHGDGALEWFPDLQLGFESSRSSGQTDSIQSGDHPKRWGPGKWDPDGPPGTPAELPALHPPGVPSQPAQGSGEMWME